MRLLILAVAAFLLFGCIGVPQEKYDSLAAECAQQKTESAALIAAEKQHGQDASVLLASCTSKLKERENELAANAVQIETLKKDSNLLSQAKSKAVKLSQYQQAFYYYNLSFGAGNVPSLSKLRQEDAYLQELGDQNLIALWNAVKNCGSISECDSAKSKFTGSINSVMTRTSVEIAQMVAGNSTN